MDRITDAQFDDNAGLDGNDETQGVRLTQNTAVVNPSQALEVAASFDVSGGGVTELPSGTSIDTVVFAGDDLALIQADGSAVLLVGGATADGSVNVDGQLVSLDDLRGAAAASGDLDATPTLPPTEAAAATPAFDVAAVVDATNATSIDLPEGTDITNPIIVGDDIYFIQPDGSAVVITNGANSPAVINIGGVPVPLSEIAVAAQVFESDAQTAPAAGPEAAQPQPGGSESSGGELDPIEQGDIGPGIEERELLDPTLLNFPLYENELVEEDVNRRPEILLGDAVVDEDSLDGRNEDGDSDQDAEEEQPSLDPVLFSATDPDGDPLSVEIAMLTEGLTSGQEPVSWDAETWEGWISDGDDGRIVIFHIIEDPENPGVYLFVLDRPLDQAGQDNPGTTDAETAYEDSVSIAFEVTVDDGQGGEQILEVTATVFDDIPTAGIEFTAAGALVTIDETAGVQDDAEDRLNEGEADDGAAEDDASGDTPFAGATLADFFSSIAPGESDFTAQYAISDGAIVTASTAAEEGADGATTEYSLVLTGDGVGTFALTGEEGEVEAVKTDLKATGHDEPIYLFLENGMVVGRLTTETLGEGDVVESIEPGDAVFAFAIHPEENDEGVLEANGALALFMAIDHDASNGTVEDGAENDLFDETVSLDGLVAVLSVTTDADGDVDSAQLTLVGGAITFQDDGPSLDPVLNPELDPEDLADALSLEVDETTDDLDDEDADDDRYNEANAADIEIGDNANTDDGDGFLGRVTTSFNDGDEENGLYDLFVNGGDFGADGEDENAPDVPDLHFVFPTDEESGEPLELQTNLVATGGGAIVLVLSADGKTITGVDTADESTVFTIAIVGEDEDPAQPQLQLTQYEAIDHDASTSLANPDGADEDGAANDLFDEVASLFLASEGEDAPVVQLEYTVLRTDGDGDQIEASTRIDLITVEGDESESYFSFDDDGPIVTAARTEVEIDGESGTESVQTELQTLLLDESIGNDPDGSGVDDNGPDDDVTGVTEPVISTAADAQHFGVVATGGVDPDDADAVVTSVADLFENSVDFGSDGAADSDSLVEDYDLVFTADGEVIDPADWPEDGVLTNLAVTALDGVTGDRAISLFADPNTGGLIGRTGDGFVALRIYLDDSNELVIEQVLPLDNGDDDNDFDSTLTLGIIATAIIVGEQEVEIDGLSILYTVTATDGDTDVAIATASYEIAGEDTGEGEVTGIIQFEDDGPVIGDGSDDGVGAGEGALALNLDETTQPPAGDDTYNADLSEGESSPSTATADSDRDAPATVDTPNGIDPIGVLTVGDGTDNEDAITGLFDIGAFDFGTDGGDDATYSFSFVANTDIPGGGLETNLTATQPAPGGNPDADDEDGDDFTAYSDPTIYLFITGGGSTIEGRVGGADGPLAFEIVLTDPDDTVLGDETLTFKQYLAIDHDFYADPDGDGDPGDGDFFDTEAILALVSESGVTISLRLDVEITDGDDDTASGSHEVVLIGESTDDGAFSFDDDGPVLVADADELEAGDTATGNVFTDGDDDDFGTDGNGGLVAIRSDNLDPDGDLVADGDAGDADAAAGVIQIDGEYGTLTITADGDYSYAAKPSGDIDFDGEIFVTDVFTYAAQDGDGDLATQTLSIDVYNSTPLISVDSVSVDEDGISPLGLPGGPGDDFPATDSATATGTVDVTDDDEPITVAFSFVSADTALTSGGAPVKTVVVGGTVYGYTGTDPVADTPPSADQIVFTLDPNTGADGDGSYLYTQVRVFDHPEQDDPSTDPTPVETSFEDEIVLTFRADVTDDLGNTNSVTFTVTVDDDSPTIDIEDADGGADDADTVEQGASITGAIALGEGADDVDSLLITVGGASKTLDLSDGDDSVTFSDGDGLTPGDLTVEFGGGTISWTFDADENSGFTGSVSFTATATDGDLDTVVDTHVITVNDSTPLISVDSVSVDEDGISPLGLPGGPGDDFPATDSATATGTVNVTDDDLDITVDFSFVSADTTLTSGGAPVKTVVVGGTVYGYTGTDPVGDAAPGADQIVFTLDPNTGADGDGSYLYTQVRVFDHPDQDDPSTDPTPVETSFEDEIVLTFRADVTDDLGNTNSVTFTVTVDDDSPEPSQNTISAEVYEDVLDAAADAGDDNDDTAPTDDRTTGDNNDGHPADGDEASGDLSSLFDFGADGEGSIAVDGSATSGLPGLSAGGVGLSYTVTPDDVGDPTSWTIEADDGTDVIFTLTINDDGAWLFDLDGELDHDTALRVRGNAEADLSGLSNGVSNITLKDGSGAVLASYTYTAGDDLTDLEAALEQNGVTITYTSAGEIELRYVGVLEVEGSTDILNLLGLGDSDTTYDPDSSTWLLVDGGTGDSIQAIDFSGLILGVDGDGDAVTAAEGAFTIAVENDVPTVDIVDAVADGSTISDSVTEGASISSDIDLTQGADGVASLSITIEGATQSAAMSVVIDGSADAASSTVTTAGGDVLGVLTVAEDDSGSLTWTFDAASDVDNSGGDPSFTFTVTATDDDGDVSVDSHLITVTDGASPTVTGDSGAVDEEGINDVGSSGSLSAEVDSGSFTVTLGSDALGSVMVGGQDVTNGGVVNGTYGTLFVSVSGLVYSWTYVLTENALHDDPTMQGADDNILMAESWQIVVADTDGTTGTNTLTIDISDDAPTDDDADTLVFSNTGDGIGTADLNDIYGADGLAEVNGIVFSGGSDGQTLEGIVNGATGTTPLTSGGLEIELFGFGTDQLTAWTVDEFGATQTVVFTATIDEDTNTYEIDWDQALDDGSSQPFFNPGDFVAQSTILRMNVADDVPIVVNGSSETIDILFAGVEDFDGAGGGTLSKVNISTTGSAVGSQNITDDLTMLLDFADNYDYAFSSNDADWTVTDLQDLTSASVGVSQAQNGPVTIKLEAFSLVYDNDDETDPDWDGTLGGDLTDEFNYDTAGDRTAFLTGTLVAIVAVVINGETYALGGLDGLQNGDVAGDSGITVYFDDSGADVFEVYFQGVDVGDFIGLQTADGDFFSRLAVTNAGGDEIPEADGATFTEGLKFDIGDVGFTVDGQQGDDITFDLETTVTDSDGDTDTGSITVVLNPTGATITGTAGDDVLVSTAGADAFDGSSGTDWVSYADAGDSVTVNLATEVGAGEAASDTYTSIEGIIGSEFDDDLTGDSGNNFFQGLGGADNIDGGDGNDTVSYAWSASGVSIDLGADMASGGDAEGDDLDSIENVIGSAHDDALTGDDAINQLFGGDGDDILAGGLGADLLNGGAGNDTFVFDAAALTDAVDNGLHDEIVDYTFGSDIIDIEDLFTVDPDGAAGVDELSDFVRLVDNGGVQELQVDADGGADNWTVLATFGHDVAAVTVLYDNDGSSATQTLIV